MFISQEMLYIILNPIQCSKAKSTTARASNSFFAWSLIFGTSRVRSTRQRRKSMGMAENHKLFFEIFEFEIENTSCTYVYMFTNVYITGCVVYRFESNTNYYWSKIRLLRKPKHYFHAWSLTFDISRVRSTSERGKSIAMAEKHMMVSAILIPR